MYSVSGRLINLYFISYIMYLVIYVPCTLYPVFFVPFTLYSVLCTLYSVSGILNTIHSTKSRDIIKQICNKHRFQKQISPILKQIVSFQMEWNNFDLKWNMQFWFMIEGICFRSQCFCCNTLLHGPEYLQISGSCLYQFKY